MSKIIVLDAGHGYNTAGKRTPDGIREWTLNNAVCNYIAEYLNGYDVKIYRTDDTTGKKDVALQTRVNLTNKYNPHVFVSIHHNAHKGYFGSWGGVEVYYHKKGTSADRKLAETIAPKLASNTGLTNRGVKTSSLWVLTCKASIPAILCEGGFMDSNTDYKIITSEDGQRKYAKAVADGLIEYLGLAKSTTTTAKPKPVAVSGGNYLSNTSYAGSSIAEALKQIGVDSSYNYRAKLASLNGIKNYSGTASQNLQLLNLLKHGKLLKIGAVVTNNYYPVPNYKGSSIVEALNKIGVNSSFSNRSKIAKKNGISAYAGTASQNTKLLNLLKQGKLVKA